MQYYNLSVEDSVADKVLAFLNGFSKNQVTIVEAKAVITEQVPNTESLSGIFSNYVTHYVTDEEIEAGIVAGASERAMKGLHND